MRGALEFKSSVGFAEPPPPTTIKKPKRPTVMNVQEMARGMVLMDHQEEREGRRTTFLAQWCS
jgi:hypothetical protein